MEKGRRRRALLPREDIVCIMTNCKDNHAQLKPKAAHPKSRMGGLQTLNAVSAVLVGHFGERDALAQQQPLDRELVAQQPKLDAQTPDFAVGALDSLV